MSDERIKVLQAFRQQALDEDEPHQVAALDAAIAALGGGWLPIESAPRDGFPRLYLCRGRVVQGFVDATGALTVQHEFGWRKMRRNPSHWMPLPAPPSKEG